MKEHVTGIVAAIALLTCSLACAEELPPLEAYGALPEVDMLEISPSGERVAARYAIGDRDLVIVSDVPISNPIRGVNAAEVNPRWLNFVDDNYVVLVASEKARSGAGRSFEYRSAFSVNIESGDGRVLLKRARGLYTYQGGLGRIVGKSTDAKTLYMPAYTGGSGSKPVNTLFAVSLEKARERRIARGTPHTVDWFLDENGAPFVREDFDDEDNIYKLWTLDEKGGADRLLYEEESELLPFNLVGVTPERDGLVILVNSAVTGLRSYFVMSIEDGVLSGPVLERDGLGVERVIVDINRVVHGVEFEGFVPKYAFFDEDLNKRVEVIQRRLQGTAAQLVSWSDDFSRLVFEVSGGWTAGAYAMFEAGNPDPVVLAHARPDIRSEHIAPTEITEYQATDGLTIPALVTVRDDVRAAGRAPLIVMPHGGPESHDRFRFDWRAQYFASRGYVVMQPQFRGSTGFGREHVMAGRGEWGGSMQSDIDDSVLHLVEAGLADPERVCIVGASYGGYAALAAGAFSPGMYRCVVAIAPVSDLRRMLRRERLDHGGTHWVIDYWEDLYGVGVAEKAALQSISPALHAESFEAPVLLLHGKNDTVVPIDQSKVMHKALRKARKDVTFVRLKGEDHWLTQSETRLESLRLIAEFIDEHL